MKYYAERRFARRVTPLIAAGETGGSATSLTSFSTLGITGAPSQTQAALRDTPALATAAQGGDAVATWYATLPSLAQLDVIVYRAVAIGLPLLTLGIITGAAVGERGVGRVLAVGPEGNSGACVVDLYPRVHAPAHPQRLARPALSWVSVIGFFSIIFCYLGVNIWISGLHSYKV